MSEVNKEPRIFYFRKLIEWLCLRIQPQDKYSHHCDLCTAITKTGPLSPGKQPRSFKPKVLSRKKKFQMSCSHIEVYYIITIFVNIQKYL